MKRKFNFIYSKINEQNVIIDKIHGKLDDFDTNLNNQSERIIKIEQGIKDICIKLKIRKAGRRAIWFMQESDVKD